MDADFQATVRAHKDRLYGLAHHLTGNRAEAEEVVQEAFIQLWRRGHQVNGASVLPWLLTVTRNGSLDRLRRRRMQIVDDGVLDRMESTEAPPDEKLERAEFQRSLQRAMEALDEPFRSLVWLRDVQGLDYETIGATLALNPSQVKVYLYRARRRLRHAMNEAGDDKTR